MGISDKECLEALILRTAYHTNHCRLISRPLSYPPLFHHSDTSSSSSSSSSLCAWDRRDSIVDISYGLATGCHTWAQACLRPGEMELYVAFECIRVGTDGELCPQLSFGVHPICSTHDIDMEGNEVEIDHDADIWGRGGVGKRGGQHKSGHDKVYPKSLKQGDVWEMKAARSVTGSEIRIQFRGPITTTTTTTTTTTPPPSLCSWTPPLLSYYPPTCALYVAVQASPSSYCHMSPCRRSPSVTLVVRYR